MTTNGAWAMGSCVRARRRCALQDSCFEYRRSLKNNAPEQKTSIAQVGRARKHSFSAPRSCMHAIGMEKEFHRKRLIHELVSCHLISGLAPFSPSLGRGTRPRPPPRLVSPTRDEPTRTHAPTVAQASPCHPRPQVARQPEAAASKRVLRGASPRTGE